MACRDRSAALLTIAYEVLERYLKEKERRGLLDYDDLIDKALALLGNVDAAWVHYKLDLGIDHVLIDEAQDTSKKQWQIVRHLTDEFTAGAGARPVTRTIFPVGDEKQSIYSFQNAAPKEFAEMRRYFERRHTSVGLDFVFRELKHSFRSGESILAAVDLVFKSMEMAASVSSDAGGFPPHLALPDALPGVVEIWEPEKPDERREIEGWDAPFDLVNETSPRVKLARRIARHVRGLIERGAARSGDVLVLVRQRGPLFEAIIRALKHEGVAVAGADRLVLTEHIAVMDLMALADALLLPQDDLGARHRAAQPAVRFFGRRFICRRLEAADASLRAALAQKAGEVKSSPTPPPASTSWHRTHGARRRLRSTPSCSVPAARGGASWRGSASRPTMRWTSSSISRSTTSGATRRRCRALSPGCVMPRPKSNATWKSPATRSAS